MWEKQSTLDDAKKLVAGPAGVEFEKYPLKFAIPAYFGVRPKSGHPATVNSGTASLVRIGGQPLALTCSHVLEAYRKRLAEGDCIFQVGNCELDPLAQLKVEDTKWASPGSPDTSDDMMWTGERHGEHEKALHGRVQA